MSVFFSLTVFAIFDRSAWFMVFAIALGEVMVFPSCISSAGGPFLFQPRMFFCHLPSVFLCLLVVQLIFFIKFFSSLVINACALFLR